MKPMGNEKPRPTYFPGRPTASYTPTPQTTTPFSPSGHVVGPEASGNRAPPPAMFNGPSMPTPPSSSISSNRGPYQRFPVPQFSPAQPMIPSSGPPNGQPMLPPPIQPYGSQQALRPHVSFPSQSQIPSVPVGPPPTSTNLFPSRGSAPQSPSESPFLPPRQTPQTSLHGYPYKPANPVNQVPPAQSYPFVSPQGGYAPPPPLAASVGLNSREPTRHHDAGPPVGALQNLVEEFNSLSVGFSPGSSDPGINSKALPRPLDGDVEPKSMSEMYPLNCHPRYLRLTTTAIPNAKSLLSRWYLPLGAVVHPLAESPDGEEVPIVNFGQTGIVRCRRCRAYVNPYIMFTDGGRKWQCNLCALLNEVSGEYFANLDANGRRIDADQRPELSKGSVDFVAPAEYMVRPPMPPTYFFLIDVSQTAVKSGMIG